MYEQITVQVTGMDCGACEKRATTLLQRLDGVHEVTADHRSGHISARIDPQRTGRQQLVKRLATAGFDPIEEPAS